MRKAGVAAAVRAAILSGVAATIACGSRAGPPEPARLSLAPCSVGGIDARCGSLTVFENRSTRTGRTIALNMIMLPATGQSPAPDPIFYLAGGPGQAATRVAATGVVDLSLREQRDLVFVDQRGTGGSNPLDCELPGSPEDPQGYLDEVFQAGVVERCRDRLASTADVRLYTTATAADDLDDVRAALGYARVNLIGGSYGSRAALTYMRRHPANVRSAVLEGVAPSSLKNPLYHARESQRALDAVFDRCAAEAGCRAAFPRVREEFQEIVQKLDREPARVQLTPPGGGAPATVHLSRYAFADTIRMMMYGVEGMLNVPLVVHRAHTGDFSLLVQRAVRQRRGVTDLAHGMLLSTTCAEDVVRIRDDEIPALTAGTFLGADRVRMQKQVCAIWPRGEVPADDADPVRSDAPVLLLSGSLDPVTPARWADEALRTLPNGRHVVAPGAHGLGGPCISQITRDFLTRGSTKDLDTSCAAEMTLPAFVTR
jgi:pimeloyl-ACP methyl ester carboxylesterase